MSLDDIFKFGKHKGHQLEDVIEDDPAYIRWLCDEEIVDFDEESLELMERKKI